MRVHCSHESLSDKDFDEQSGENWVTARPRSGHEGKEQSVVGQAVYRAYSVRREWAAECQNGVRWLKGGPSSQESVEWLEERGTAK